MLSCRGLDALGAQNLGTGQLADHHVIALGHATHEPFKCRCTTGYSEAPETAQRGPKFSINAACGLSSKRSLVEEELQRSLSLQGVLEGLGFSVTIERLLLLLLLL